MFPGTMLIAETEINIEKGCNLTGGCETNAVERVLLFKSPLARLRH